MFHNTALLKIGGGLVAAGGTAGAGYYAHTQGLFKSSNVTFENESEENYLIVKTTDYSSDVATGELYDVGLFSSQKNFTCSAIITGTDATTDDNCEIYKLSNKEKNLAVAITNNHSINAENIKKAGNYIKIKSPKLIDQITKWEHSTDQLISISKKTEPTKLFGKLTPVYKVKNGKIVARKTSFLYAKVKSTVGTSVTQPAEQISATTTKNYQCQLGNNNFDCSIVELSLDTAKKIVTLPTNAITLTNNNLKTDNKHFQIQMEEEYLNKITFTEDQTINLIASKTPNTSEHYAKLTPVFNIVDKEISLKNSFWLLAKPTETASGTAVTNYTQCKIGDSKEKIKCDVYKFSSNQNDINAISFSGNLTKTSTSTDINSANYLVIKFENNPSIINTLEPKINIILSSTATGTNKEYTLTVEKRLIIEPSNGDTLTVNSVHMLD